MKLCLELIKQMNYGRVKSLLGVLFLGLLSACEAKIDGTYSNNVTGVAEQKLSFTFKPDGTASMAIGSTEIPLEMPYEVSGNEIKVTGQEGDIILTILDNGDLLTAGLRLKKEDPLQPASSDSNANVAEVENSPERDMPFCRELAAKARAAQPGQFADDRDFLPNVSFCYGLATENGETLVWSSEPSSPQDQNTE